MNRSPVMEDLEEKPPRREPWTRWVLLALVLSIAAHVAFIWWARTYAVKTFSDAYYDTIVPRSFKVDRVEIDSRLLDETSPAAAMEEDLTSMREALLADTPSSAAQPAIELAAAAGRAGAEGTEAVPAGYSDLDDLLAQTGGLSPSAGPIFMPSDVLFGYDESFLRPEAITSLEKLGELIRRNPEARFRIEGHTDSFGGADYNAQLSLARAESVKRWLADTMTINPARIDARGLGGNRPLAPTTGSVEEQQLNRRVEIVILRAEGGR